MQLKNRKKKTVLLCTALCFMLLLAACGGSADSGAAGGAERKDKKSLTEALTGSSAVQEADTGTETNAAADTGAEAPDSASASFEGGVVYDANDIVITITGTDVHEGYTLVHADITNSGSRELMVSLYPLVVNHTVSVSDGLSETVAPGGTVQSEVYIDLTPLQMAGISSLQSLEGYIMLEETDNYNPVTGTERILLLDDGSGGTPAPAAHSDQVVYDRDGIRISYLGFYDRYPDGSEAGKHAVFMVSNETEYKANIGTPYREERIDGASSEDKYMVFSGATVMPGDCSLVSAYIVDYETFNPTDYSTAEADMEITTEDPHRVAERLPFRMENTGDSLTVTCGEVYITEEAQELQAMIEETEAMEAAEAQHDADLAANAEDVQELQIEKTGIYNYTIGTSSSSSSITGLVSNPNERTAFFGIRLEGDAYDTDGNLLGSGRSLYYEDFVVLPGEALPVELTVKGLEFGTEVDHVELTISASESVNTVDLQQTVEDRGLMIRSETIRLDNTKAAEGNRNGTLLERYGARFSGTLVNDGEDAEKIYIILVMYNSSGEIILSGRYYEDALAGGESREIDREVGTAIYELPDLTSGEIWIYAK